MGNFEVFVTMINNSKHNLLFQVVLKCFTMDNRWRFLNIYPWVNRDIFSILVAILEILNTFLDKLFQNYLFQILNCFNMPGRGKGKGKCNLKQHTYNVHIGFANLDRKYSKYSLVVLMDVLTGV